MAAWSLYDALRGSEEPLFPLLVIRSGRDRGSKTEYGPVLLEEKIAVERSWSRRSPRLPSPTKKAINYSLLLDVY